MRRPPEWHTWVREERVRLLESVRFQVAEERLKERKRLAEAFIQTVTAIERMAEQGNPALHPLSIRVRDVALSLGITIFGYVGELVDLPDDRVLQHGRGSRGEVRVVGARTEDFVIKPKVIGQ